ncbi:MAG: hypothetical protein NNA24_01595 [Nitrospira sp.]|nr:hypothetical protein [Nitrospira sp.]
MRGTIAVHAQRWYSPFVMRCTFPKYDLFRLMVLAWLGLWVLAVPFVHVHPEVDHHHGEEGHTHGGLVHTIWSPDLECEFDHHGAFDYDQNDADGDVEHGDSLFHAGDHHAEFALTMLGDSSDRRQLLPPATQPLSVAQSIPWDPDRELRLEGPNNGERRSLSTLGEYPSRAPPLFFI